MGLTILPIRKKSVGECGAFCPTNKKDTPKTSVLSYPQEHFLVPPTSLLPNEKIVPPIVVSPLQRR
jgi:hypothetical protein